MEKVRCKYNHVWVILLQVGCLTVDDNYLYESIRNPGSRIVEGFQNLMPANVAADMSDDKVNDVIRFIESLK